MSTKTSSTAAKKTGKKGFETEEIVRSYFLAAGFFVVRGVKLRHGSDDLTDIDLWLYERSATLARRRIIIDIKDNAQPKAAERLFFVKGLAEIIQVEATGVATSDSRRSLRELARKHNVLWIDNADLQRLKTSQRLAISNRITDEELDFRISSVDLSRSSRNIKNAFADVKSAVADRFGTSCANAALDGTEHFARMSVEAHPNSLAAEVGTRLTFFSCAIAAAAFDFASGESALRPQQERLANLTEAIRFGADPKGTAEKLRWAEAAIRDFAPNGAGIAEKIRRNFNAALHSIPAEGVAEIIVKLANSDRLFNCARELEQAAFSSVCPSFDDLSVDARSFIGAALDFTSVDRLSFANTWRPVVSQSAETLAVQNDGSNPAEAHTSGSSKLESGGKLL